MRIWVTSDTHFNHENILRFGRGKDFKTLKDMNEKIICNWNEKVSDEDIVYVLGDMFMGDIQGIEDILPRLKGRKILIRGNHDTNRRVAAYAPYMEDIRDILKVRHRGTSFIMCHYPMREWEDKERGSIHLYGHVHDGDHRGGVSIEKNSFHVGMDDNDYMLHSLDSIKERFYPCKHPNFRPEKSSFCKVCGKELSKMIINGEVKYL